MKIDQFIEQKKTSWNRLSELIKLAEQRGLKKFDRNNLLELGRLYRQASSDLSYTKSSFKDREIINYLNQLVARAHSQIYLPAPFNIWHTAKFYLSVFPDLFRQSFSYILLSCMIFVTSYIFSYVIVKTDTGTAKMFLPDEFVIPVEEGLKEKYVKAKFPSSMGPELSSKIMTNNISVGFRAFAFGITAGIGTVYVLIFNGFMLGSLAALFNHYHYDMHFWSLILPHGITELLAIFISGGAGLILADGMITPGDLTRADSIKTKGRKAIRLILGVIPMFIIAGIIEGFITPLDISPYIKLIFSVFTGLLLILYFSPIKWHKILRYVISIKADC
ncbi:MAG: stage II sporulation protein M [Candidatus Eremiobacterota bacterium]